METLSQDKHRAALIEKYEMRAFECLALYNYYGRQYATIENNCQGLDKRIEEAEKQIADLDLQPHSKENGAKKKSLKQDINGFKRQIQSVGELGKKFFEKATGYQEEGGRILEQIEDFKEFVLKTPAQIIADKTVKVAEPAAQTNV